MLDPNVRPDCSARAVLGIEHFIVKVWHWIGYACKGTLYSEAKLRYAWWRHKRDVHLREQRLNAWYVLKPKRELVEYRLKKGLVLLLPTGEKLSELIYTGSFERVEQQFIRRYLKPGDVFVDVGANVGLFALIAAKAVGNGGLVYAFEPTTSIFQLLTQNVLYNRLRNVHCYQLALSDKSERRLLTVSTDGYSAFNSLGKPTAGSKFLQEEVQCVTWDYFAKVHGLEGRVALMKIDVEGWEYYVLEGGSRTLSRGDAPDLLIEFTDENAKAAGLSCAAVYNKLRKLGYQLYSIDMEKRLLNLEALRSNYPYVNLVATKRVNHIIKRLGFAANHY